MSRLLVTEQKTVHMFGHMALFQLPRVGPYKSVSVNENAFRRSSVRKLPMLNGRRCSPDRFECDALLLAVSEIGHVRGHGGPIADLDRCIRLFARTNAVDEIGHMIQVLGAPFGCHAVGTIYLLRKIPDTSFRFTCDHIGRAGQTLDRAARAEIALAQTVVTVTER